MGFFLKNTKIKVGEYTARMPYGTTTQRPAYAKDGQFRFNTTLNVVEFFFNGGWKQATMSGTVTIVKDLFVGDGSTLIFSPMTYAYSFGQEVDVFVFVDSVYQNPGVAYTFDGSTTITFSSPPPNGATILILHNYASTGFVG